MAKFDLASAPLFKDLDKNELSLVNNFLVSKKYQENAILLKKGEIRDKIFIITSGLVALQAEVEGHQTIALFKEGDVMSEMTIIEKEGVHQYNLRVVSEELETMELLAQSWPSIIKKSPQIATKIYKNIALDLKNKLNHSNNKLVTLFASGKIIGDYDNLENISDYLLKIILRVIPSDKALFITYSPDITKAHVRKNIGYTNIKNDLYFDINSDNILKQLINEPDTAIFYHNTWPKGSENSIYKCQRVIITPIHIKKRVCGFIILGNKKNGRDFSDNNKILLEAIATQVAPAIEEISLEKIKSAQKQVKEVYIDPFNKY
ncbi:cyclic nucleotide-binding domain-containing protein [Patescibacteria group bacterium]|nr:cyclic nucleotide-binding domain-containing protein [Patescibacteria group bacterium]